MSEVDNSLFPDQASLNEANSIWKGGAEAAAKSSPVGTFTMKIVGASLEHSASSARLQIHYDLEVIAGGPAGTVGTKIQKYDGMGSDKQASITQQQLKRLGVDTSKITLEKLPAVLVTLAGKLVLAVAKQNGGFYNISFNKIVQPGAAAPAVGAASSPKAPASSAKKKF